METIGREFNDALVASIDETITTLLSPQVVDALYSHLERYHSISRDEIPYRLETLYSTLEKTFGTAGSKTISRAIARKFYQKLGLTFADNPGRTLVQYVEEAKVRLNGNIGNV